SPNRPRWMSRDRRSWALYTSGKPGNSACSSARVRRRSSSAASGVIALQPTPARRPPRCGLACATCLACRRETWPSEPPRHGPDLGFWLTSSADMSSATRSRLPLACLLIAAVLATGPWARAAIEQQNVPQAEPQEPVPEPVLTTAPELVEF